MTPAAGTAMLAALLAAAPASGQGADVAEIDERSRALIRPALDPALAQRDGISFRIDDRLEPDGTEGILRGIIAGFDVAPDTTVGVGLFESLPKRVLRSEESPLDRPKRSRKAAVGMTFKF